MLLDHGGAENWRWISAFKDIMVKIRAVDGLHKEFIVLHFYQAPTSKGIDSLELIQFNSENAEKKLPTDHVSKEVLELTQQHNITSSQHAGIILNLETGTKLNGLDELMADQKLEIIMTPLDSKLCAIATAAKYPWTTFPA
ncbi:uncharacterized protein RSE6_05305 [Rhynchosporium secalis]|uniref:Uncharacterized protein n=1 Tax=Rhynchosporium secalis TaxID=38038 RepID=A0A1E1M7F0_RHYSE|nr:uncharacterized protein RSE6_05305 [Rhynchosporium secalis]